MNIILSGASGFVGCALASYLEKSGHNVFKLVRRAVRSHDELFWSPEEEVIPSLSSTDAVINLAGETIFSRWTNSQKEKILTSRVRSTELLAKELSRTAKPSAVYLNASAVGFYGNRDDELLTEQSGTGTGFLADVCKRWEEATQHARSAGIRTTALRFGIVLSKQGGALAIMLPAFKAGVGGPLGDGKQWMSWISLSDLLHTVSFLLNQQSVGDVVNVVSPHPIRNIDFSHTLARSLHRPAFFKIPKLALKAAFGEMGEELLLSSQKVVPQKLLELGFQFRHRTLEEFFKDEI